MPTTSTSIQREKKYVKKKRKKEEENEKKPNEEQKPSTENQLFSTYDINRIYIINKPFFDSWVNSST